MNDPQSVASNPLFLLWWRGQHAFSQVTTKWGKNFKQCITNCWRTGTQRNLLRMLKIVSSIPGHPSSSHFEDTHLFLGSAKLLAVFFQGMTSALRTCRPTSWFFRQQEIPRCCLPCADCSSSYIGETGNFIGRLKEHQRDVGNNKKASNALAEHADNHRYCIDWDNVAVIAKEKNSPTRLLLESAFIQTMKDTINRTDGNLPASYTCSLHHLLE